MTILTTERLRFEPFDAVHLDGLQTMNRDPEVQRYLLGRPETPEETLASIGRVKARWAALGYSWWAFIERDSGELVGAGCIQHLGHDPANPHEIGWRLRRDRWGMGLASEAARELVRHGFEGLQAPLLCAIRHPGNAGSARVMDKLGMRYAGLQRWGGEEVAVHQLGRDDWIGRHPAGA
ncbi:GNAT family N-acetyltransferase [Herbaspirillum sp. SJZ107]|uniref:GNAT family N-acetyltransferase n=1 Tax=Herbaspirillum sp. SJZ107 TaxID=2572881 RepID=UPI00115200D4|nr:GNAT family N-acetyltransferase [Herbaspirillum sp. SJZ107]TQK03334.1 RimJ/RimL family protein N-acetyltransferase [Herbaspirillum sp. SJZ107]